MLITVNGLLLVCIDCTRVCCECTRGVRGCVCVHVFSSYCFIKGVDSVQLSCLFNEDWWKMWSVQSRRFSCHLQTFFLKPICTVNNAAACSFSMIWLEKWNIMKHDMTLPYVGWSVGGYTHIHMVTSLLALCFLDDRLLKTATVHSLRHL